MIVPLLFLVSLSFVSARLSYLPKEWKSFAVLNSSATTGYLIHEMYRDYSCAPPAERTESMALGACYGGIDEQGKPMESWISTFNSTDGQYFVTNDMRYKSTDCTGAPYSSHTSNYPMACYYGGKQVYKDVSEPEPWAGVNTGVVVKNYNSLPCEGSGNIFQAVDFSFCMGIVDPGNGAGSMRYTACSADKITFDYYSDCCCGTVLETRTIAANECNLCPGSASCYPQGFWWQTHETISCNA